MHAESYDCVQFKSTGTQTDAPARYDNRKDRGSQETVDLAAVPPRSHDLEVTGVKFDELGDSLDAPVTS